ncbi:hypothetical protein ACIQUZ_23200 [Streptomyces griseus]|uniref:Uncharacterized protein n=1 Tax=Streptomyces griseus subsp. griseus (strain JCM 4626 / CBS 651.72 / NBRC 13350 / KCC S-0626 / ISP 5235) TaxID=455632 RepID=B1W0W0_STRGG|nr:MULTISPECIES: hypothetical protein [Streptomyces]KUJ39653.1 hypothetical protein ACZ90_69110 [Streptomyces albus subsp. albus]MYR53194.1 hypothetical protein [Streptomyces sp. SID4928]EGE45170.1 hypothetical protein SACT1_5861 [Streptomyces sp. ACT-1]MBW3708048.1 hypothetical protein [Streptomyces griseus]NEB55958.1 hypothetical protein [Streptomyces griseus]
MSVTATVPRRRRRIGIAAGATLLVLAVSGCSGLGRTAVGPVTYKTEREAVLQVNSPSVRGCHRIAPAGAREVENGTLVDVILYRTRDCTGGGTTYVPTTFSDVTAPGSGPWRSYSFVH